MSLVIATVATRIVEQMELLCLFLIFIQKIPQYIQ